MASVVFRLRLHPFHVAEAHGWKLYDALYSARMKALYRGMGSVSTHVQQCGSSRAWALREAAQHAHHAYVALPSTVCFAIRTLHFRTLYGFLIASARSISYRSWCNACP